ncbi:alpha/beta hydrolase [Weeksellaceae bacterium TAE3-ERU29]|nr:alpha/beta hydrolase [Weeksellaceae bacterium TAE3-ERU29]
MKTYFISGLGGDETAFERLTINSEFEPLFIDWKIPEKNEDILHYAKRMANEINDNEPFILVGYSFGGIIAQEINRLISPEKTILISSVKNREELSPFIQMVSKTGIHKVTPISFFTSDGFLSYAFFRKMYDRKMPLLKKYFNVRDPYYLKWSINQSVNWQPKHQPIEKLYHIHGDKDIVFPIKYIKNAEIIKNGTHLMPIQKHKQVSDILNNYLLR